MSTLEEHYTTLLQGIRRQGGTVQVYANIPLPLASALDLQPGETVTWKVVDRTHLLLVRLPDRKPLTAVARPEEKKKKTPRSRESHSWWAPAHRKTSCLPPTRSISIMSDVTVCTGTWRRTGNTCSGMKTSPPCTVLIMGAPRWLPAWRSACCCCVPLKGCVSPRPLS